MPSNQHDQPPSAFDALEFEFTDLSDARHALDELPAGVMTAQTLAPGYWLNHRRKAIATDRALTGAAIDWLLGLPERLRPTATCEQFPRIVNALAASWTQPADRDALLDSLLSDSRSHRAGFPLPVRTEIEALRTAARTSAI
jgi:hypothetical protein